MIGWLLAAVYALGIIPAGVVFLRTGLDGYVNDSGEAVLLGFFWPLMLFVLAPILLTLAAITRAVEILSGVRR